MHQYVSIHCTESEKNLNSFCKGKGIENIVETGINSWNKNSRYGILERHNGNRQERKLRHGSNPPIYPDLFQR